MPYIEIKSLPIGDKNKQTKTILDIAKNIEYKAGIVKSRLTIMWTYIEEGLMFNGADLVNKIEIDKNGPIIYIDTIEGKSTELIAILCDAVCCAISDNLKINKDNMSIIVNTIGHGSMFADGKFL